MKKTHENQEMKDNSKLEVINQINSKTKFRNILIGIICILMVIVVLIILPAKVQLPETCDEVAYKCAKAEVEFEIKNIDKYCVVGFGKICGDRLNAMSEEEKLELFKEAEEEYGIPVKNLSDFLKVLEKEMRNDLKDDYDDGIVSLSITENKEISMTDLEKEIDDLPFDVQDYIDKSKIEEPHKIMMKINLVNDKKEYVKQIDNFKYLVFKYYGEWKVLLPGMLSY